MLLTYLVETQSLRVLFKEPSYWSRVASRTWYLTITRHASLAVIPSNHRRRIPKIQLPTKYTLPILIVFDVSRAMFRCGWLMLIRRSHCAKPWTVRGIRNPWPGAKTREWESDMMMKLGTIWNIVPYRKAVVEQIVGVPHGEMGGSVAVTLF